MADRIKKLIDRIKEWWNHFTSKQKTIIVSVAVGVIVLLAGLVFLLTRPQYILIASCETAKEGSEITKLLTDNNYQYRTSQDATQIYVLKEDESEVNLLLGANDILSATYTVDNVTGGGFSTTESDKQKKYVYYKEKQMEEDLQSNPLVRLANVQLSLPEDDGTLIANEQEGFASVVLDLDGELDDNIAASMARFIATALGNETTKNITIIDTDGNLLFAGEDNLSSNGNASTQLEVKKQAENLVKQEVKSVLLGTNLYDDITVAGNLVLDFSTKDNTQHNYTPAEGQTQGVLSSEDLYQQDTTGTSGGEPGTGSNDDDTTYQLQDYSDSSSSTTEESRKYLPNEYVSRETIPPGLIKYNESSISVTAKKLHVYRQEDVDDQGLLVDMTWEEYKQANQEPVKLEVDTELYSVVSKTTGIAEESIQIMAYEVPVFVDKEGFSVSATDIIQIVLIIVILGLLAFVVLRSMAGNRQPEEEEELSVETLIQSQPESELEDIEFDDKSEARILIEKFVEENPEAVANLLRNWLQEDWG